MTLVALDRADPAWAELVAAAPEATAFHHPAWRRVLADAYGYPSVVLAEPGRGACVVLARVPRLRGRAWVSLPFSDHCPPLARDGAALERLAGGLAGWAAGEGASVEVRGVLPAARAWSDAPVGVRHVLPLGGDPQAGPAGTPLRPPGRAGSRPPLPRDHRDGPPRAGAG